MSRLGATLERLYGLPAGPCSHAGSVYDLAMATYTASRSWDEPVYEGLVERYPKPTDVLRTALANGPYTPIYADIFGFMTNAVLVATPFRHEAVWVELEPPHLAWFYDEGWRRSVPLVEGDASGSRFLARSRRAWWIYQLLPDHHACRGDAQVLGRPRAEFDQRAVQTAYNLWLSDLNGLTEEQARSGWREAPRAGSAEALLALWTAFFLGAPGLLIEVLDETEGHPSAAVASARALAHEAHWSPHPDRVLDHLRAQRAAFLALVRGSSRAAPLDAPRASLAARLPGGLPDRVKPELALRPAPPDDHAEGGWALHCGASTGLSVSEAAMILQAPADPSVPVVALTTDGRGDSERAVLALVRSPAFAQLRALSVTSMPLGALARALVGSPHTAGLRALEAGAATEHDLEELSRAPFRLTALRLPAGGDVGPHGFAQLASAPTFAELRELVLPNSHCRDEGLLAWVASGRTEQLRLLSLPNNYSGADVDSAKRSATIALLSSPLPGLTHLNLASHDVGDEGAAALATNPRLGLLRTLALEGCQLTARGVAALAGCAQLRDLEILDLYRTIVGPAGALAVAESPHLTGLRGLRLFAIEDEGAASLATAHFSRLDWLDLERGRVGSAGLIALASAPWMATVRSLALDDNHAGTEAALALAASPHARAIEQLKLYKNPVGEQGIRALLTLPALRVLSAYDCGVRREHEAALRALRPEVQLTVG